MNFENIEYLSYFIDNKKDFTIRFTNNDKIAIPSTGFVVSITPFIDLDMNINAIIDYVSKNKCINIYGKEHKLYIGGWFEDENKLCLDISIVTETKEEAMQIGKQCNQEAIYHIDNKNTIYITNDKQ